MHVDSKTGKRFVTDNVGRALIYKKNNFGLLLSFGLVDPGQLSLSKRLGV